MKSKFLLRNTLVLFGLIFLSPFVFGVIVKAQNSDEFIKTTFEPTLFSKTVVANDEIFTVTLKSKGVAIQDASRPSGGANYTFRIIARNQSSEEQQVLNSGYVLNIKPFPQTKGESYETSKVVSLQFPSESQSGEYTIIEELNKIEMIKPSAPSKPSEPIKPSAPTKPSEPTT